MLRKHMRTHIPKQMLLTLFLLIILTFATVINANAAEGIALFTALETAGSPQDKTFQVTTDNAVDSLYENSAEDTVSSTNESANETESIIAKIILLPNYIKNEDLDRIGLSVQVLGEKVNSVGVIRKKAAEETVEAFEAPLIGDASDWAAVGINEAYGMGLIPKTLQSGYTQSMTRAEFTGTLVQLFESYRGEITERHTFIDTDDVSVQKAAAIGVVNGVGGNMFAPDGNLTHEHAIKMLSRLACVLELPTQVMFYAQCETPWIADAVSQAESTGLIEYTGGIIPLLGDGYQRQQGILATLQMHYAIQASYGTNVYDSAGILPGLESEADEPQHEEIPDNTPQARNYDWYVDQIGTGDAELNNCGPASAVMAAYWSDAGFSKTVKDARAFSPRSNGWWYYSDIAGFLRANGIPVTWRNSISAQSIRNHLDNGEIVIVCIEMRSISYDSGIESQIGKPFDANGGHFFIVKGYANVNGVEYFEVYDPFSIGVVSQNWEPVGKNRLYRASEVVSGVRNWEYGIYLTVSGKASGHRTEFTYR